MNPERTAFIKKVAPDTVTACAGKNLFPSVMLAQNILESNNGKSQLATKHNNFFGIKASNGWSGGIAQFLTTEYINGVAKKVTAAFRSYPTMLDGFKDRIRFLQVNPRYTKAGVFEANTPEEQAKALQRAGYATDPQYAKKLIVLF